jgi:hypothetical protein
MAVPTQATYSVAALTDTNTALLALIDAGAGAAKVFIRDASDILLAEVPLTDPAGTISGAGVLTITASGPDLSANASGVAAYCEIADSDDTVILSLPAAEGTVSVAGYIVFTSLTILATKPVTISAAVIG